MQREHPQTEELELEEELGRYAGRVLDVVSHLPEGAVGRHLGDQLLRSGTAPGAHYAEARNALSHSDFTHKISLAAKEMRESLYWLRVADHSEMLDREIDDVLELADRLVGWLHTSARTARTNKESD